MKKQMIWTIISCILFSQMMMPTIQGKETQEVRAVWIATVYNIDFPSVKGDPVAQKAEFVKILDELETIGINTVIVQIRPKGDALYASKINPWSDVLTGTQGKDPGYDPLAFMIEEAHKRGMSIHGWLNPYRVTTSGTDVTKLHEKHPARLNPSWVMSANNALYYNPEVAGVKAHIVATVEEIIKNYNVDGIHFDDYFYPSNYPLPTGEHKDGTVGNQRRAHVNDMVQKVSEMIKKTKPEVQFGISPIGIWKNEANDVTGSKTSGGESYYQVFADTRTWIQNQWIDYVVPQIYWETTHQRANYETLVKWWSKEVEDTGVALYIGHGIYKDSVAKEIDKQLKINQQHKNVSGSFFYNLKELLSNRMSSRDVVTAMYQGTTIVPRDTTTTTNPMVGKSGTVAASTLNVRGSYTTSSNIITKIPRGTAVTVLDTKSEWYQIRLGNGTTGWVLSEYLNLGNNVSQGKKGTVTANQLNVRKEAGTHYASIGKVTKGMVVDIINERNGWYQISLNNGQSGWVSGQYIAITK